MLDLTNRDRCFLIAEAGTCHAGRWHGRCAKALRYVDAAAAAGASAIKFQLFRQPIQADMFCWLDGDKERSFRWAESDIRRYQWGIVKKAAEAKGLVFLASAFQFCTVGWLRKLGVEATKVASRAARDFPYEAAPAPFLISDGMYPVAPGKDRIVLECESNYPSTARWKGRYPGFSDHSGTPERAIDAIRHGCKLVEVHFFIDPADAGPDLPASLDLDMLRRVCDAADTFAKKG